MESIKINKLEIENVKRIKAVKVEPTKDGLTVIGGRNGQGKTSVLDAIAWALGGEKYKPSQPEREGSVIQPHLHIVLSNGLVVERKGKNSSLKVTDPGGNKGGQQLLNEFVEQLAINLPKFLSATGKEKAQTLLKIIGVGDRLLELEQKEQELYNQRQAIGRIADQKKKYAKEQTYYPDAPRELVSATDLIKQQQEILARNGENQRKREKAGQYQRSVTILKLEVEELQEQLKQKELHLKEAQNNLQIALMSAENLQDESTAELETNITNIEEINRKVRVNLDKDKAEEDALGYENQYNTYTAEIGKIRNAKTELLKGASLPLPGLSVEEGELVYNGFKWDNMSGAEQLKVATAIIRKLNPQCGFVLLDKLEQMDADTLNEFGQWLEKEGLQAIATRVSTGEECSILISDGYSYDSDGNLTATDTETKVSKAWKAGTF